MNNSVYDLNTSTPIVIQICHQLVFAQCFKRIMTEHETFAWSCSTSIPAIQIQYVLHPVAKVTSSVSETRYAEPKCMEPKNGQ